jgi:protein-disulfide isomerase
VKLGVALAAIVVLSFTAGWWVGRTTTLDGRSVDIAARERLARVEGELEGLKARLDDLAPGGAGGPGGQGAPDPDKVYEIEPGGSPGRGPAEAPVTIVEFADFECPFCASVGPTLKRLLEVYPQEVRLVFKHNPLPIHPRAQLAHRAAAAAGEQGKFWEMHDLLFRSQEKLGREDLKEHARSLGLDLAAFESGLDAPESAAAVEADQVLAGRLGVGGGVPSFFINGRFVAGAQPYDLFRERVEEALKGK